MKNTPTNFMPKAKSPCLDCKDRAVGCHALCAKYLWWKAERESTWERNKTQNANERMIESYENRNIQKWRKK